jgi:hypothetical protein
MGYCDMLIENQELLKTTLQYITDLEERVLGKLSVGTSLYDSFRAVSSVMYRNPCMSRMEAFNLIARGPTCEQDARILKVLAERGALRLAA